MSPLGRFAALSSVWLGSKWAFLGAGSVVVIWAASGPLFLFSSTWALIIGTVTSITTFMMVFLIQNTQNRDSHAIHLKLDELIRAVSDARTRLVDLQDLPEADLRKLEQEFKRLQLHPEERVS